MVKPAWTPEERGYQTQALKSYWVTITVLCYISGFGCTHSQDQVFMVAHCSPVLAPRSGLELLEMCWVILVQISK